MSKYDKREIIKPLTLDDWSGAIDSEKDIVEILRRLEEENEIEILYASQIGSRIYGYSNKNSDYNVRFIYKPPLEEYMRVCHKNLSIEKKVYKYEVHGWDVRKALSQHYQSNPLLYEWTETPIKYFDDKIRFRELMPYDKNILLKRFYQVAQHSYNKGFNELPYKLSLRNIKEYLYSIRYILMWNVLYYQNEYPPITLKKLLYLNRDLDESVIDFILFFMQTYKEQSYEEMSYHELANMNSWISNSLRVMRNTYPLRPKKRNDCYYYNSRFLEIMGL